MTWRNYRLLSDGKRRSRIVFSYRIPAIPV
jgi:hypothetical protein